MMQRSQRLGGCGGSAASHEARQNRQMHLQTWLCLVSSLPLKSAIIMQLCWKTIYCSVNVTIQECDLKWASVIMMITVWLHKHGRFPPKLPRMLCNSCQWHPAKDRRSQTPAVSEVLSDVPPLRVSRAAADLCDRLTPPAGQRSDDINIGCSGNVLKNKHLKCFFSL